MVLVCVGVCVIAAVAGRPWYESEGSEVAILQEIVVRHITALRTDEYAAAYTQTSNAIKVRYDMAAFKGMLQDHYLPVFSARRVELGAARVHGKQASVRAYLVDAANRVTPCTYHLVREQGIWKISGVFIQPTWPTDFRLCGLRA